MQHERYDAVYPPTSKEGCGGRRRLSHACLLSLVMLSAQAPRQASAFSLQVSSTVWLLPAAPLHVRVLAKPPPLFLVSIAPPSVALYGRLVTGAHRAGSGRAQRARPPEHRHELRETCFKRRGGV